MTELEKTQDALRLEALNDKAQGYLCPDPKRLDLVGLISLKTKLLTELTPETNEKTIAFVNCLKEACSYLIESQEAYQKADHEAQLAYERLTDLLITFKAELTRLTQVENIAMADRAKLITQQRKELIKYTNLSLNNLTVGKLAQLKTIFNNLKAENETMWCLYTFQTKQVADYRPLSPTLYFPYWKIKETALDVTIKSYLPFWKNIKSYWPDAYNIKVEKDLTIEYTNALSRPEHIVDYLPLNLPAFKILGL